MTNNLRTTLRLFFGELRDFNRELREAEIEYDLKKKKRESKQEEEEK